MKNYYSSNLIYFAFLTIKTKIAVLYMVVIICASVDELC